MSHSLKKANWPKDLVERLVTPPSVTVATQEGEAELPQFLLLLAGALDGPAGEALSVESPVVIAPEVSNAVIATLVSLLSSGRTPSSVSVADEATLKDLTSNLGIVCNFTRESNVPEQILSRGFRAVNSGVEIEEVEVGGEDEVEDISDERYAKMHKKGEMWEKKVDRKQQQSARWKIRKDREMGKKKVNLHQKQKPGNTSRIRLGPDPEAATHIFVEEDGNVPITVFGRVVPTNQDAEPFKLPWLKNPVSSTKRKSSGVSKKPASKQVGGNLKNGMRKAVGANAEVQETVTIEKISGGNSVKENNTEEEVDIEGDHLDQENNACQVSGKSDRVIPRSPKAKEDAVPKRGKQAGVVRVEEKATEKKGRKTGVKFSSRQKTVKSLVKCKCCAFRGSGSALLGHLFIHYSAEMTERYKEDLNANRCTECGFSSSSKDNYHLKRNMLRHIGVIHKKILKFTEI